MSVLPSMSKVVERVLHSQLVEYFTEENLLFKHQYGFRKRHNTELAALEFIERIVSTMDKNEVPLAIFLDLSKAFDTLNHQILIHKLEYYGIRDNALQLLQNYLANRKQCTVLNSVTSSMKQITTGVPQGSILGPLLFVIYINDLVQSTRLFQPVIYADDTTLQASLKCFGRPGRDRDKAVNSELEEIAKWFTLNKLSVNPAKTRAMLFHSPKKRIECPVLFLGNSVIEYVENFDFLGITVDKNLTWKPHVQKVSKKLSKTVGILSRLKNELPQDILLIIYNSLFLSHINYGLLCWGSKIKEIEKIHKKAIRIISKSKYNSHTEPLFKKLKLLKAPDIVKLQLYKFCYRLQNELLPAFFMEGIFTRASSIHQRNLRTTHTYRLPRIKHEYARNSIGYSIAQAYNECPENIRSKFYTHSYNGVVIYIKQYCINSYESECRVANCYICNYT